MDEIDEVFGHRYLAVVLVKSGYNCLHIGHCVCHLESRQHNTDCILKGRTWTLKEKNLLLVSS